MRPSFDRKAGIKLDVTTEKKWRCSRISWIKWWSGKWTFPQICCAPDILSYILSIVVGGWVWDKWSIHRKVRRSIYGWLTRNQILVAAKKMLQAGLYNTHTMIVETWHNITTAWTSRAQTNTIQYFQTFNLSLLFIFPQTIYLLFNPTSNYCQYGNSQYIHEWPFY